MKTWLFKSEPDTYSIDDLQKEKTCFWEGVRNYQARNFLRDEVKKGDFVLFYHSNCKPPGIVGLAEVIKEGTPDPFALDPKSDYFDPKASEENPRWYGVTLKFLKKYPKALSLEEIKASKELEGMLVAQKGQRLSIQPVETKHYKRIETLCAV